MVKCKVRGEETVNTCRVMGTGQRMWRNCAVCECAVRVVLACSCCGDAVSACGLFDVLCLRVAVMKVVVN